MLKALHEDLRTMALHSTNVLYFGNTKAEATQLSPHHFTIPENHQHIHDFLVQFAQKHPESARHLATKFMNICETVLSSEQHAKHHENARILHEKIHTIRLQIDSTLKENSSTCVNANEDERIDAMIYTENTINTIIESQLRGVATTISISVIPNAATIAANDDEYVLHG